MTNFYPPSRLLFKPFLPHINLRCASTFSSGFFLIPKSFVLFSKAFCSSKPMADYRSLFSSFKFSSSTMTLTTASSGILILKVPTNFTALPMQRRFLASTSKAADAAAAMASQQSAAEVIKKVTSHNPYNGYNRIVAYWLYACGLAVAVIVVVGGITRLTESGLSIVDWKPLSGVIPPLNEAEWEAEFKNYQQYPEFKQHPNMTLEEFKNIFFWEWFHRVLGRAAGILYGLPLLYFAGKGYFKRQPKVKSILCAILAMYATQGFMGWYMVRSGLDEKLIEERKKATVSAYRLAAHLTLAFLIYSSMMRLGYGLRLPACPEFAAKAKVLRWARISFAIMFITAISGAFVAGLDAGLFYNDEFPFMAGGIIPPKDQLFRKDLPIWRNFFESGECAQTWHRGMAFLTILAISGLNYYCIMAKRNKCLPLSVHRSFLLVNFVLILQVFWGIRTIMTSVQLDVAAAHQGGAVALLTTLIYMCAVLNCKAPMLL